jgi:geranylgeranyl diphosphate synthase type II
MSSIGCPDLKSNTEDHLDDYLNKVRALVEEEILYFVPKERRTAGLYELMLDYPLRKGKALRPAICLAVCQAEGGILGDALPTAAVLELYHNAFLIHDDVEDESLRRRNEPTLHQKIGVPAAINVGDAMLAIAMRPLLENTQRVGLGKALNIFELVARMARESAEGQMLELQWRNSNQLPTSRDYIRMVYKKTSWYSFIAPAMAGATLANCQVDRLSSWRNIMLLLGIGFQIVDDYLNLYGDAKIGKESHGDLWEGKMTLILISALQRARADEQRRVIEILAKPRPDLNSTDLEGFKNEEEVLWIAQLIDHYDGADMALLTAQRYAAMAYQRFLKLDIAKSRHWDFLDNLFDYITRREL